MNKKGFFKLLGLCAGLSLAVGAGVALSGGGAMEVGAGETLAYTLTPANGTNNSYAGNCDVTISGITWNVTGNSTMQPWRLGGKSLSSVERTVYSKTAISDDICKVDLTVGAASSITVNSLTLIVDDSSDFKSTISEVTGTFNANSTINFTRPGGKSWEKCYFKFVFNVTVSGSSNKFVEFSEAKFYKEVQTYKVTYDGNGNTGGTVPTDSKDYDANETVTVKDNSGSLAKTGYTFGGWNTKADGSGANYAAGSGTFSISANTTLYAKWTLNNYSVDATGLTNGTILPTSVDHDAEYYATISPSDGYTFPESLTVKMGDATLVADEDYLYDPAQGTLIIEHVTNTLTISGECVPLGKTYSVTYDANGGLSDSSEDIVENGHPTFPAVTKDGYNFKGWKTEGDETLYTSESATSYAVTDDVTFIAQWAAVYTVTFDSNGGSEAPASKSVESGSTFTFPSAGTKEHHDFLGWSSTGGEPYLSGESPAVSSDVTYTAYWKADPKYTVTYTAGDNGTGTVESLEWSGSYTLPEFNALSGIISAVEGYQFKNYTVGGENKNPGAKISLSDDTKITVNFEEKPIVATYNFVTNFGTYAKDWSGYGSHTLQGTTDLGGDYSATITLPLASKQSGTITTMPVVADQESDDVIHVSFELTASGYELGDVSITFVQWGTKTPTMKLLKGTEASGAALDSGAVGTKNTLSATNVGGKTFVVAMNDNSTSRNQVGIQSISLTLKVPPVLDKVTSTGHKDVFSAGEKFSYGGTLTASYTKGKASAPVTPKEFRVGAEGIDPTSAGTVITSSVTMTIAAHDGKYIYVIYAEDDITKYCSYKITVNPAAPTSIELSSSSATISVDEEFSFADIEVTINPFAYATQDAYEWIMQDDLGLDVEFDALTIVVHEDSNDEPLIIRCRSTVDNNVYADFELTVSAEPNATLFDSSNNDVTGGSAEYFADHGADLYYSVSAVSFGNNVTYTWESSNSSVLSVDDVNDNTCGFYIECNDGSARLSCTITGSKGTQTVYIDVTIKAVTVTSVSWNAPTIDVFTGDAGATIDSTMVNSWNVKYDTNSGKTDQTPNTIKVLLGGAEITLPYTLKAGDHGKTLGVEVGGVKSTTTTVKVTQRINTISEDSYSDVTKTWTAASGDLGSAISTVNGTKSGEVTFDDESTMSYLRTLEFVASGKSDYVAFSSNYIQLGSSNALEKIELTAQTTGTVKSVVVNCWSKNGASNVSVTVGGASFDTTKSCPSAGADVTFTGSASGTVVITIEKTSKTAGLAQYIKSVSIKTSVASGSQEISNVLAHAEAQRAVVKFAQAFNSAMDATQNCTTGLDTAWAACQEAYNMFKTDAASDLDYAKSLLNNATRAYSNDSPEACVERMMRTYEICVKTHDMDPFMSELVSLSSASHTSPINGIVDSDNTMPIIVIASLLSITAVGGYLFLRRRNEQ